MLHRLKLFIALIISWSPVFGQNCQPSLEFPEATFNDIFQSGNYNFIMVGEYHFTMSNELLQYEMCTLLNRSIGLRTIILECPHSLASLLNFFMTTGDSTLISGYFARNGYYQYFNEFRIYNKSLAENKKLKFIGVTYELGSKDKYGEYIYFNRLIEYMLKNKEYDQRDFITKHIAEKSAKSSRKIFDFLKSDIVKRPSYYENLFGDYFKDVQFILAHESSYNAASNKPMYDMILEYKRIFEISANEPFYCQIGAAHIQPSFNKSLYSLLANNGDFKIFSIQNYYSNCKAHNYTLNTISEASDKLAVEEKGDREIFEGLVSTNDTIEQKRYFYLNMDNCKRSQTSYDMYILNLNYPNAL